MKFGHAESVFGGTASHHCRWSSPWEMRLSTVFCLQSFPPTLFAQRIISEFNWDGL